MAECAAIFHWGIYVPVLVLDQGVWLLQVQGHHRSHFLLPFWINSSLGNIHRYVDILHEFHKEGLRPIKVILGDVKPL